MKVVGIAGGTASGKSTLCRRLTLELGAAVVAHDSYYRTLPEAFRGERIAEYNFDHPDALDTARLLVDLAALQRGETVQVPVYDFAGCRRLEETERVVPTEVLIVEGILVLAIPELRARFDVSVFVDCPADIRLARRLRRDCVERGDDPESLVTQYLATVRPMHQALVQPSAEYADLRVDGRGPMDATIHAVKALLSEP